MKRFVALICVMTLLVLTVLPICAQTEPVTGTSAPEQENVLVMGEAESPDGKRVEQVLVDEDGRLILVMSDGSRMKAGKATELPPENSGENQFQFMPEKIVETIGYMGTGMIGIFLVIGLIVLATIVLNRVFHEKKKQDE